MRNFFLFLLLLLTLKHPDRQSINSLQPITTDNTGQVHQVGILGRGTANAMDWRPDGQLLAVGSSTGVWLLDQDLKIISETALKKHVDALAWSPDSRYIAVSANAADRCMVEVWDSNFTEEILRSSFCGSKVLWSADNIHVAVVNLTPFNNVVLVMDVSSRSTVTLPGQDGTWSPSGKILFTRLAYTSTFNSTPVIYTWDVVDHQKQPFVLEISEKQFLPILWGLDDHHFAVQCSESNEEQDAITTRLCSLDTFTGKITPLYDIATTYAGQCICISSPAWNTDKTLLAYVREVTLPGWTPPILTLNTATGEILHTGYGNIFDWKPASNLITAIMGNGEINTFDPGTDKELVASSFPFNSPIHEIAIRPDTNEIASTGFGYDQKIGVWNLNHSWTEPRLSFRIEPAGFVAYTPDGAKLIAGGVIPTDIVVNLNIDAFNPDTGKRAGNIAGFYAQGESVPRKYWNAGYTKYAEVNEANNLVTLPGGITIEPKYILEDVSWSPDDSTIATVERINDDYSFYVRTWDITTGKNINTFSSGMFAYKGLAWSRDSKRIAVMLEHPTVSYLYTRGLRVFSIIQNKTYEYDHNDFEAFETVDTNITNQQTKAAWNSDGTLLAVTLPGTFRIYSIENDQMPLASLPAYDIVDLEWSTDDRFIAGGSSDGTIVVWGISSN